MVKLKKQGSVTIYRLKIVLRDIKPTIWRCFQINGSATLAELHYAFQAVMGWTNTHLHQFYIGQLVYGMEIEDMDMEIEDENEYQLDDVLPRKKKFRYEYDFGDGWGHDVTIEKVSSAESELEHPVCLEGAYSCPPEDVGGVYGYADFLEAIGNPKHPRYSELKEWIGGDFDPEAFDVDEVNEILKAAGEPTPESWM